MSTDKDLNAWMSKSQRFVKIRVGQKYECEYVDMKLDAKGGFEGKATVRYTLKDIDDGGVREFSSSSKGLAKKMMTLKRGDRIIISSQLNERDMKTFDVVVVRPSKEPTDDEVVMEPEAKTTGEVPF